eukprot:CFRG6519T1
MPPLTTHVLNTATGVPAANLAITVERQSEGPEEWTFVGKGKTNSDGRCPDLLPENFRLETCLYRITFDVKEYFEETNTKAFYPYVQVVFQIEELDSHYHVPLLLSPYGFSTYRGS